MTFRSISGKSSPLRFREAVMQGLAPDGSLYIPEKIPPLPPSLLEPSETTSWQTVGAAIMSLFIDELTKEELRQIIARAWNFPVPLVQIDERLFVLELFHGPTLAFKDVGARFMAQTLSWFLRESQTALTILVATSGDTGSAVAHGFYKAPHITVYVLYPSGKISRLQEQQITTLGANIHAVEVSGTFDDCQRLVKQALNDPMLQQSRQLTTANSINLGRLLPQISYAIWGMAQYKLHEGAMKDSPVVVVPSGNLGNLTAAAYAKRMGAPMKGLIAATNINDVFLRYLATGVYVPSQSLPTLSNAMDVGSPNNLARLQALYNNDVQSMKQDISAQRSTDEQTLSEIVHTYRASGYILDPHTAVGVAAARSSATRTPAVVFATAHPAKFSDVLREALETDIPLPPALREALTRPKQSVRISTSYTEWKDVLLSGE